MKTHKGFYYLLGVGCLTAMAACTKKANTPPNIVIIYADDVGIGDLHPYGTGIVPTPNVDRLAKEGVRFTNAHTTSATSTPSRYGLLTGTYPWRRKDTHIARGDAAMIIKPNQFTLADMAKNAGYTTAAVGKWHLGLGAKTGEQNWNKQITPGLESIGFDYSFIMAATGDRVPCVYIEDGKVVDLDLNDPIEVSYTTPFAGEPTGRNNPEMLKMYPSHGHDMALVNGISRIGYMRGGTKALWRDEDIADRITDKAIEFIDKNKDKPFLLYFGTNDIHVPRAPHERFVGKSGLGARGDAIVEFDYSVGAILDALEKANISENTLVILSSDNGPVLDDGYKDNAVEMLGEHNPFGIYRGGKYSIFEAGTLVPMIVKWTGNTKKGLVSKALFSQIDVLASLAKIINSHLPGNVTLDSEDASKTLLGQDLKGREYIVEHNAWGTLSIQNQNSWKYIESSNAIPYNQAVNIEVGNNPNEQLYNLEKDAGEQKNLAIEHTEILDKLKAILTKEKQKIKE